jgi:transposase InsO family protein
MTMVAALAAAVTTLSAACPLNGAVYQLRGEPGVTARFEERTPSPDWVAKVSLSIHSAKTGATYFLLPYSGNGHARAVLETWRRDYNEQRPHSKLGWMTPRDYARAICGPAGDRAAQPGGSARTPLATHLNPGSDQPRTLVMAG